MILNFAFGSSGLHTFKILKLNFELPVRDSMILDWKFLNMRSGAHPYPRLTNNG
jgi:hypothetical protein